MLPTTPVAGVSTKSVCIAMKLLKIKDQIINIDLLESVNLSNEAVTIQLAGVPYRFTGEESVVLREWFNRYAFDLNKSRQRAIEQTVEDRYPVELMRQKLPSGGLFRKPFAIK